MRTKIFIAATGLLAVFGSPVVASSVALDVAGPNGGNVLLGGSSVYQGVAATFTANQDIMNAQVGFDTFCFSACDLEVRLVDFVIDPTVANPNIPVRANKLTETRSRASRGALTFDSITQGITLQAGHTYTLFLRPTAGSVVWLGTFDPTYTGSAATAGTNFTTRGGSFNDPLTAPFLAFDTSLSQNPLTYSIQGDFAIAAVPLPATGLLLIAACAGLGQMRRKRR